MIRLHSVHTQECNSTSYAHTGHFIKAYTIIQTIKAATQNPKSCWYRTRASVLFTSKLWSLRSWCWYQAGCFEYFINCWSQQKGFTDEGCQRRIESLVQPDRKCTVTTDYTQQEYTTCQSCLEVDWLQWSQAHWYQTVDDKFGICMQNIESELAINSMLTSSQYFWLVEVVE